MAHVVSQPRPTVEQARAEHQRHHAEFMRHIRQCDRCTAYLCETGRGLEIDADAAGWRFEQATQDMPPAPIAADVLTTTTDGGWWTAAAA
jgi:hypothetical protein